MSKSKFSYTSSDKDFILVKEIIKYTKGSSIKPIYGKPIALFNYVTSEIFELEEDDIKYFRNSNESNALKQLLSDSKLIDNKRYNFDISVEESEIYVKLTEGCNFACPGCATSIDVIPSNKAITLDEETLRLFLKSFVKSSVEKGYKSCHIKWAGGEPLLAHAYKLLVLGIQFANDELQNEFPDIQISHTILTNGVYLTEDKAKFFSKYSNIALSVSLWGYDEIQDEMRRPRANQKGSYSIITNNIKFLHKYNIKFNINHVIAPGNMKGFAEFLRRFWDIEYDKFVGKEWNRNEFIPVGFYLYRPLINKSADMIRYYLSFQPYLREGFNVVLDLINRGIKTQPIGSFDYLKITQSTIRSCGSGMNYIAIGPDGVSDCHEGLYNMKPNLDRVKNGENLFDIAIDSISHEPFLLSDDIEFRTKSRLLKFHGGQGCPRVAMDENNGNVNIASSAEFLYKNIYNELLSLEIMKAIQQQKH